MEIGYKWGMGVRLLDDGGGEEGRFRSRAWVRAWGCVFAGMVGVWCGIGMEVDSMVWFAAGCGLVCLGVIAGVLGGGWVRRGALWLAVVALMGGVVSARIGVVDGDRVDVVAGVWDGEDQAVVRIRGVVVEGAEWREGRREVWEPVMWSGVRGRFGVEVRAVFDGEEWAASRGVVRVVVPGALRGQGLRGEGLLEERFRVGDVVEVMGVLRTDRGERRNVGDRDWELVTAMEDRAGVVSVVRGGMAEVIGNAGGVGWSIMRWRSGLRERAMGALGVVGVGLGDAVEVVIWALLLGERTVEGREVERGFARVGVGHVLAVSGFHVALLAGMCVFVVRVCAGFGWGVRLIGGRVWVEGVVVCLVLLGMWVLVPVRVPVVRAMVLIVAVMVGRGLGRRYDTMAVLGWVAVGLMVWRPMDVFGLGFQLSVGVTALLVWMGRGSDRVFGAGGGVMDWVW
ncbi:MAG: ComEC/Rec2 family competence protein, partial [Phycisphaerales bacterium]|nr:ComEC/Rec2 family competence protein [Phycisphaerales bacterium]